MPDSFKSFYKKRETNNGKTLFHITHYDNLRSILSQGLIPNAYDNFATDEDEFGGGTHSSYEGVYVSDSNQKLMDVLFEWDILEPKEGFGLIVIEDNNYNQKFMDEDDITGLLDSAGSTNYKYITSIIRGGSPLHRASANSYVNSYIEIIYKKFENEYVYSDKKFEYLKNLLQVGRYVLYFRNLIYTKEEHWPKIFGINEDFYKFTGIRNAKDLRLKFRSIVDKITKLRLSPISQFNLPTQTGSFRINKHIKYKGNPKIVGVLDIYYEDDEVGIEILYDRMSSNNKEKLGSLLDDFETRIGSNPT